MKIEVVELKKDGRTYEMNANHLKATNIGLVFGVSFSSFSLEFLGDAYNYNYDYALF